MKNYVYFSVCIRIISKLRHNHRAIEFSPTFFNDSNYACLQLAGLAVSREKGEFVKWWAGRDDFDSS